MIQLNLNAKTQNPQSGAARKQKRLRIVKRQLFTRNARRHAKDVMTNLTNVKTRNLKHFAARTKRNVKKRLSRRSVKRLVENVMVILQSRSKAFIQNSNIQEGMAQSKSTAIM